MAASTSGQRRGTGAGKKWVLFALFGTSFLVFVAGSVVFAYLFLISFSVSAPTTQKGLSALSLPPIQVPLLSNPPPAGGPERTPIPGVQMPASSRINFLLLGIDQRDDEKGAPTRSDTMMVVSVDQASGRAAMISLARDLWVEIPGYADNRINVANFLGDAYRLPGGGPALARKTVEQNFGLKIDYHARIDFRGFEKIVDTLGGVTVDVERAIVDNEYPTEDYEVMRIYIPAGVQHMNGKVALQYARSRHSENDFGRARRQQRVLLAIRDRALQLDVIPRLPSLVGTLLDMVNTDIPPAEFLRLAKVAKDVGPEKVSNLVIDDKLAQPFRGEGGADLLMPNKPEIRKAIAALFADPVVQKEAARIEVVNGTNRAGLATRMADYLKEQGFDVVKVSSSDRTDHKSTEIAVTGDKKGTATLIATVLKLGPQAVISRPLPASSAANPPDIRVILGQDVQ